MHLLSRMRSFWLVSGAFGGILCAGSPVWAAKPDSVPDWVHQATDQKMPELPSTASAVVLLDDTTYTVDLKGQATEHRRRVVKILRPDGRDQGVVAVPFDNEHKILSLHVWSIAPDGHEYSVKDNEMVEIGSFGDETLYNDEKVRAANPPGRDPGGVIAYEYDQKVRPYLTEATWFFQDKLPELHESFTLQLPAGFTYGTVWANHEPVKEIDLEKGRWRWELNNVPMLDVEEIPMRPSSLAVAGRMTVHYSGVGLGSATDGTWRGIGQWYAALVADRLQPTPEIAAKAAALTAGKASFFDKTEAIATFVQKDVRYVAVEIGIGGLQPHPAGEILQHHYGDCKDKATLLSAMLSTVGIHANLVMVDDRRGVVQPGAPSTVGDHVIAAIVLPKEYPADRLHSIVKADNGTRYLLFDPTSETTPFGQVEHELQGGYGLLAEGSESQLIQIPVLDPELARVERSGHFHLDETGSLTGAATISRFGDAASPWRVLYTAGDQQQQERGFNNYLRQDLIGFSVKDLKVENVSSLNKDLTMSFSLDAGRFGKSMGQLLMVRPRVFGTEAMNPDHKPRTLPIDLDATVQETDDYDIDIPAGYAVDELPPPVKLDLGFAAYSSQTEKRGNTLHYTRSYVIRQVTLSADRYADLQRLASAIHRDEQSSAVLKKQ